jgi:bidirectional [NiFe] hydrogenase diaphorase subunit
MIEVTIDGNKVAVEPKTTIFQAAAKVGVWIPTLCHHDALTTYGACRTCLVEIVYDDGWRKMVTACNFPIETRLSVETANEKVLQHRKMVMELLLARCPNSPEIKEIAAKVGVTETRFPKEDKYCILCGLCTRVCEEAIGRSAISFTSRGIDEEVDTPFEVQSDACIGCGACAYVCPTNVIFMQDKGMKRTIKKWHAEFDLVPCKECGKPITTKEHLEYLKAKLHMPDYVWDLCPACKQKYYAERAALVGHM